METSSVLLVIDIQEGILEIPGLARASEARAALAEMIGRVRKLIAGARTGGIPVVYVQHDGAVGHRLEKGTPGWNIHHEIAPESGDIVVNKTTSDSFCRTDLKARLDELNATHLIVVGCMTQFCVDTTVRSAISHDYSITLVSDAHMTSDFHTLRFEQIIQHHNDVLGAFAAVTVKPSADLALH
jgi:nicotinamidase-related amidase